jgi:hypothetical protein
MGRHVTDEERIVDFFNTASTDKAETLLNVINGIMRTRTKGVKTTRSNKNKGSETPQSITKAG